MVLPSHADLLKLATDFAKARKAYLAAHAADYQSIETAAAFDVSEDALEKLEEALHDVLQGDPDRIVAVLSP